MVSVIPKSVTLAFEASENKRFPNFNEAYLKQKFVLLPISFGKISSSFHNAIISFSDAMNSLVDISSCETEFIHARITN